MTQLRWARLNPMHPLDWERQRTRGRLAFVLTRGILGIGLPIALVIEAATAWLVGSGSSSASIATAIEASFIALLIAPLVGVLAADAWWEHRETRHHDALGAPPRPATIIEVEPLAADARQRSLAALESRLEVLAERDPKRLTHEIVAMTALGYGYVLLVAVALIWAVVFLARYHGALAPLARQGAWFLGGFTFFVLSSLNVRIVPPGGRRITRAGSPALFDALGTIQQRLDAPVPDVVLVDSELNAAVHEILRFGIVGVPRRYLVLGLPLFEGLPADECVAILAHELGHLSRRHAARAAWSVRLGVTWRALAISLEASGHWARPLFLPFFRWYAPRFELYAKAVSRRNEHESDAMAIHSAGGAAAARGLLRLHAYQRFLTDQLLPAIYRRSAERAEPPAHAFEELLAALRAGPAADDLRGWARTQLAARTLAGHSHPSLAQRLGRIIGSDGGADGEALINELFTSRGPSGAEALLGATRLPKLRAQIEQDWQLATLATWRKLHSDARVWREAEQRDGFEIEFEALWAHARWAIQCEPREVALPLVREVLKRVPSHVEARVALGELLSKSDDSSDQVEGVATLEAVMRRDTGLALFACAALEAYYQRMERREEVDRVQTRERQLRGELLAGLADRRRLRAHDRITAYPLPASSLASLRHACMMQGDVTRAFLVRKYTRFLREQPCVMLAIECAVPWYKPSYGKDAVAAATALLSRVVLPETADLFVLPVEPRSALSRRLRGIRGALIYERSKPAAVGGSAPSRG